MDELFEDEVRAERADPGERVEQGLVLAANAIWAVVGLVLWLPQVARVVLSSAWRLVHAALTRQSADAARGPIRRASRFYVAGFMRLEPPASGQTMYSSRDLRLRRLLFETLWAIAFYLVLLRLVSPDRFATVWQRIGTAGSWAVDRLVALLSSVWGWMPEGVRQLGGLSPAFRIVLVAVVLLVFAAGWVIGRRR